MKGAFICDGIRTLIGRYGGALASVRTDDLAAAPIRALMARNPAVDWAQVDDVLYGCANQAGEDNRNVARMAALLAGLPAQVLRMPGWRSRSCGSCTPPAAATDWPRCASASGRELPCLSSACDFLLMEQGNPCAIWFEVRFAVPCRGVKSAP